jgi:hypothetical protein
MPRYAVDASVWFYVDADNADDAFGMVHAELSNIVDNFEIVDVEESD